MNSFTKKGYVQKILIALVFVILFNFISPKVTFAGWETLLVDPVMTFVTVIGDSAIYLLQKYILGQNETFYELSKETWWEKLGEGFLGIAVGSLIVGITIAVGLIPLAIGGAVAGGVAVVRRRRISFGCFVRCCLTCNRSNSFKCGYWRLYSLQFLRKDVGK